MPLTLCACYCQRCCRSCSSRLAVCVGPKRGRDSRIFASNASVRWQPDGLTIHTKKWLLGAGFLYHVIPYYITLYYLIVHHVILHCIIICYAIVCYVISYHLPFLLLEASAPPPSAFLPGAAGAQSPGIVVLFFWGYFFCPFLLSF